MKMMLPVVVMVTVAAASVSPQQRFLAEPRSVLVAEGEAAVRLDCVDKISVDTSSCMKPCSGLIVTSFTKSEKSKNVELYYPKIWKQYNNFKTISSYPPGLIGIIFKNHCHMK